MSRAPLRLRPAVVLTSLVALGGFGGCSPEEAASPLEARPDERAPPPGAPDRSPDAAAAPAPGSQVTIRVRGRDGAPVVGRALTVVDARGARSRGLTDEEGAFVFEGVVRPYDCAVEGAPLRAGGGVPTVLAGLRSERAEVDVDEEAGFPAPLPQTLRLAVRVACDDPPCEGWALSASASGEGAARIDSLTAATEVVPLDLEHRWRAAALVPGERIRVRILLASRARSSFRFAEADAGVALPGGHRDLGALDPSRVDASEVQVVTSTDALTGTWRSRTQVALRFDDGVAADLGAFEEPARALRVPLVPGASLRVDAWAERRDATFADVHAGARAQAIAPPSASQVALDLRPGPTLRAPTPGGGVSRRAPGLAWDLGGARALVRATIAVDDDRGGALLRLSTSGGALSFARLGRLGLPRWPVGPAVLELDAFEGVELYDWVDPTRARRRWTNASSRRVRFVVTP